MAPRKVRAVSNLIKGKDVLLALAQLEALIKRSGSPVVKLLKSAIANAENNNNMVKENLYIRSINVDEGVKLKRFKPKGFGRVSPIEKKTSRIRLILAEKTPGLKRTSVEKKIKESKTEQTVMGDKQKIKRPAESEARPPRRDESRIDQGRPEIKTKLGRKEGVLKSLGRKMFRRKVI